MDKSDELKETKTGGPAVRKFNGEKRKECAKALKVVTLVITLAATACLFSLPIIFHFVKVSLLFISTVIQDAIIYIIAKIYLYTFYSLNS